MKRSVQVLVALTASLFLLAVGIAPANAYTPYSHQACVSSFANTVCLAWTGGWPTGQVRVEVPTRTYYAVRLQTCGNNYPTPLLSSCGPWSTVASKTLNYAAGVTPSVLATRNGWYRACSKVNSGSSWNCAGANGQYGGAWPRYLGD